MGALNTFPSRNAQSSRREESQGGQELGRVATLKLKQNNQEPCEFLWPAGKGPAPRDDEGGTCLGCDGSSCRPEAGAKSRLVPTPMTRIHASYTAPDAIP